MHRKWVISQKLDFFNISQKSTSKGHNSETFRDRIFYFLYEIALTLILIQVLGNFQKTIFFLFWISSFLLSFLEKDISDFFLIRLKIIVRYPRSLNSKNRNSCKLFWAEVSRNPPCVLSQDLFIKLRYIKGSFRILQWHLQNLQKCFHQN